MCLVVMPQDLSDSALLSLRAHALLGPVLNSLFKQTTSFKASQGLRIWLDLYRLNTREFSLVFPTFPFHHNRIFLFWNKRMVVTKLEQTTTSSLICSLELYHKVVDSFKNVFLAQSLQKDANVILSELTEHTQQTLKYGYNL